ncbi:MAG: flagellar protein FliT [Acetatifactor sp.]|nr:flagellar protein FliT [Acetatifactor sp.]
MENQLTLMIESMDKKLAVMEEIQKYNEEQASVFQEGRADIATFDRDVELKDELIEKLMLLDSGFETMYEKLAEQLKNNKEQYAAQIRTLQEKIKQVTAMSVSIQAQEKRNKALIEQYFAKEKEGIRKNRQSSKAAYDYYKSMSQSNMNSSSFMDSKQ